MAALVTIEAVAIGLLALLVAGLLRSHAEILRRLHDLGAGVGDPTEAPVGLSTARPDGASMSAVDVTGTTPDGDPLHVAVAGARHDTLLAFLSTGCLTCETFWQAFQRTDHLEVPGGARLVVVTKGKEDESARRVSSLASPDIVLVMSSQVWADYNVPVAPYFIYVAGPSGQVLGEGAAASWEQVSALLSAALEDAGVAHSRSPGRFRVRRANSDEARGARTDGVLMAAGIGPGHPSLYPNPAAESAGDEKA